MQSEEKKWVRWYHCYRNLAQIMEITEQLPRQLQLAVGQCLLDACAPYQAVLEQHTELKSIGPEVVMSIHKSQRKERWYDTVPPLHKALNAILALPDAMKEHLDNRLAELSQYLMTIYNGRNYQSPSAVHQVQQYLTTRGVVR